jgi:hypothetical protein
MIEEIQTILSSPFTANMTFQHKGLVQAKPAARRGRKATGLQKTAGLPRMKGSTRFFIFGVIGRRC